MNMAISNHLCFLSGIMIVTAWVRTMSLFHDIKLKRRKIDTHCNSDSETLADVNTSSPESLTTDGHARDHETGSASGGSTTQTYLSEDGGSIASGSPPQLDISPDIPVSRDSSPLHEGQSRKRKEPTPDNEHVANGIVESPQHERRNSVFDGGGGRSNGVNCREGLDLRRTRRDTDGSSTSPSSFEEQVNGSMMRGHPYKPPLVMGDIPGAGPGKTMLWSTLNNERVYDCTNSSPPMDSIKQVSTPSPVKLSPVSGSNHQHSPLQPQVTILSPPTSMSGTGIPAFPTLYNTNSQSKSILGRTSSSYNPNNNARNEVLMNFAASSSRSSYGGRDGSPVGFTRFWPSNSMTNGDGKVSASMVSSSPPRPRTDSEALNLTTCGPGNEVEASGSPSSSNAVCLYPLSPSLSNMALSTSVSSASSVTSAAAVTSANHGGEEDDEDQPQPMVCMICEDKATGLHYGIITCEG